MVLDHPLRIETVLRTLGYRDVAAIEQLPFATDAAHAAPGPRADEWSEAVLAEKEREDVTVGCGVVVDQTDLGTDDQLIRNRNRRPLTVGIHADQDAPQTLEHDLIDEAAAIPAVVDDQRLLVELSVELPHELIHAARAHIRKIDVGDPAGGGLLDVLAIVVDPRLLT